MTCQDEAGFVQSSPFGQGPVNLSFEEDKGRSRVCTLGRFRYRHHYVDREFPGQYCGQSAAADVDGDGRPELIFGIRYGDLFWYDWEPPGQWRRYLLGRDSPSDVGAAALDVDGDGWVDVVTGGAWYRNSRDPRRQPFERFVFDPELKAVHDVVVGDVDGDGRPEVLTMADAGNLRWYKIPADPTRPWIRHDIGPAVHAGASVGDLDGDGDLDVVRSDVWFENVAGDGSRWVLHPFGVHFGGASGWEENATLTWVADVNGDGHLDVVVAEAEIVGAQLYRLENLDGRGGAWRLHELPPGDPGRRGPYHSLYVGDLDGDGDVDIFSCEAEDFPGDLPPRWFIWENLDGRGGKWREHVILDQGLGGHGAVAGDFDGDGDLDFCAKLWTARPDNANGGRMHVDFLKNLGGAGRHRPTERQP